MGPTQESKTEKDITVLVHMQGGSLSYELHGSVHAQHQPCDISSPAAANPVISPDVPWLLIYSCKGETTALPQGF